MTDKTCLSSGSGDGGSQEGRLKTEQPERKVDSSHSSNVGQRCSKYETYIGQVEGSVWVKAQRVFQEDLDPWEFRYLAQHSQVSTQFPLREHHI